MFKLLSGCIASTDNLLTLHVAQSCDSTIFGRVTLLPSKIELITQFTKRSDTIYAARLRIDIELLQKIEAATIHIEVISSVFHHNYPDQELRVDREKINSTSLAAKYKEVKELKLQLSNLEETLRALTEGRALTKLSLKNTDSIAPGMVPVAIDNKGNFIGAYPFNDMIKDINGVKPIGSSLKLTASDIPLSTGSTLEEAWKAHVDTDSHILKLIVSIEDQLSALNKRIKDFETKLATHLNTGII